MSTKKPRWALRIVAALVVLGVVAAVGAFVVRNVIATSIADRALRERGLVCVPLSVSLAWDLSAVDVAPTACTIATGRVASLGLAGGAHVALAERTPTRVVLPDLELGLRDTDVPQGAAGAMLAGDVPEPLQHALDGMAQLSARTDVPRIDLELMQITGRGRSVTAHDVHVARDGAALTATIASVAPPPRAGLLVEIGGSVAGLRIRATPSAVSIAGELVLDVEVLGAPAVDRHVAFRLSGAALDGPTPHYELWVERSERLDRLRALIAQWRARREARDATPPHDDGAAPHDDGSDVRQDRVQRMEDFMQQLRERRGN